MFLETAAVFAPKLADLIAVAVSVKTAPLLDFLIMTWKEKRKNIFINIILMGFDCLHATKLLWHVSAQYAYKTKCAWTEFTLALDGLH